MELALSATALVLLAAAILAWGRMGLPGPWGVPFFYNFFDILQHKARIYDWFTENTLKYGDVWMVTAPAKPWIVVVSDTKSIDHVLRTNFDNYIKGPNMIKILHDFLGDGIFNTNGRNWKQQRQTASHLFKVKELRHMAEIFLSHGRQVVEILEGKQGQEVDMQELFARFTLDSIGEIAFGKKIGSLEKPVAFSLAFNQAQLLTDSRFQNTDFWMPWIDTEREMREALKVLDEFAYGIIKERRQDSNIATKTDLLSRYIGMTDDDGEPFTDKYLRDIVLNFMIAGRDTTSQALTWCFYLLSLNPAAKAKLVAEVDSKLGGHEPSFANVDDLPFLHAVVNETLRLYPPVPVDSKSAVNDDVLPNGAVIRAGMSLNYPIWVINRLPQYWDRPNEFWPERWLDAPDLGASGLRPVPKNNSLPFIPFNFGPRTCLGMKMAYLEVKMMAVLLLQRFELELAPNQEVQYKSAITLSAKNGIRMVPRLREQPTTSA
ncbi:cytochrome p450 superfamily protein [Acanthamoeba castellanii str. Neff]|uniref:Cytochrome p450 superfamily protein n=1 Tax=Acanthamoeba castellanii (strain ATCC 30010 / Neff) TaxID=1257118 RepID=L8GII5_ACACF|nr:cytochrome p450 superfamily protein [Acanthamoeba castellanii str. Neff]ELR12900.1 cytochrome p450 superfamily protein [Acanthamoeba castellanii str. Neff]